MFIGPTLTDLGSSDIRAAAVNLYDGSGNLITTLSGTPPATATLSTVAASVTSVTVLAANANRKKAYIVNNSTSKLWLAFAATASKTAFTVTLAANAEFETDLQGYTGIITGLWNVATGNAQVTEVTP